MEDPITLDGIRGAPYVFVSKHSPYQTHTFGARSLATYVIESLHFDNPLTREELNTVEVMRLARLANNPDTWDVYTHRHQLAEQRELRATAMRSHEWDLEDCLEAALVEGEQVTDQFGIADSRDVHELIHDLKTEIIPEMTTALRGILYYETMPRMERNAASSVATKMIEKLHQKSKEPPYVDERILKFLCNYFQTFLDQGATSLPANDLSLMQTMFSTFGMPLLPGLMVVHATTLQQDP